MSTQTDKMTKELHLKLVEAWWDGELEISPWDGEWNPAGSPPGFRSDPDRYRIRPKPTLCPWKPEEVPVGALLRAKEHAQTVFGYRGMITYVDDGGIPIPCGRELVWISFEHLLGRYEHSIDGGKTWKPCGVEEGV